MDGFEPVLLGVSKEKEAKIRKKIGKLFSGMMEALYEEKGASMSISILETEKVQDFIQGHSNILDSALAKVEMSDTMRQRFSESNYIFSGMKTFHELNEAFPSLLNENGERKPFNQFLNDVKSIDSTYNETYLKTEYNFVNTSAEMAGRWESFEEDEDRYLLQYRTAGDDKVRPEHAEMNGITLPKSSSFWDEFYPPNGYNCRCTVVEVLRTRYPETDLSEAFERGNKAMEKDAKQMFRFNPGKEGKSFPSYNAYTISKCATCERAKTLKLTGFVPQSDICSACDFVRECAGKKAE